MPIEHPGSQTISETQSKSNLPVEPIEPIRADRPCIACGYNLRGLRIDANCPECGSEVWRSLADNALRFADLSWLRKLRRGCRLLCAAYWLVILYGIAIFIAVMVVSVLPDYGPVIAGAALPISMAVVFAIALASFSGLVLATRSPPRIVYEQRSWTARHVAHGLTWISLFVLATSSFLAFWTPGSMSSLTVWVPILIANSLPLIALNVAYVSFMRHMFRVARHSTSDEASHAFEMAVLFAAVVALCYATLLAAIFTRRFAVLAGLLAFASLCTGIGALVTTWLATRRMYRIVDEIIRDRTYNPEPDSVDG